MKFFKVSLTIIMSLMLLFCIGNAFASDVVDLNSTVGQDNPAIDDSSVISVDSSEIEVNDWEDIQYYASLSDKNYVLKLKENTNYYPKHASSSDDQIIFNNNVTIIGSQGAYIGDSSPNPRNITYTAMKVPDNNGIGITFKGVTFKWIASRYQPDGLFMVMGGNAINYFEDCYFTDISTTLGHSAILHIKLGDMVMTNCTFINCTNDFGCISVYNPDDDPTTLCTRARLNVTDSYFEGNYGRTAPGAINNCGILVVRNSTFYKNSAFWWAGAVHTTGGANTTVYDSLFLDNVAGWNGGAMYTYSYLQIYNTTFLNNNCTTSNGGGAIGACKHIHAPFIYVQDSLFQNNENTCWSLSEQSSGTGRGGAISIMDEGGIEVRNTTFIKNSASLGTAICAINAARYGSPYVILVGNRFINHTRVGDVLDIRLSDSSYCEIRDNYYYNNSFEFKKIRLLADEKVGDDVVIHIDAELKNPDSFESDILDVTPYDIYVDGVYNMTVIGRTFTLTLKNGKTCNVYAVPVISNSVSNEIFVGVPKEYVYVSQSKGKNTNDGLKRSTPVKTIAKAIQIAKTKGNIVIMDGTFTESNLTIDYNLNIIGEDNVKFTGAAANSIFTVSGKQDLSISNVVFDSLVFSTKSTGIIRQASGFTVIENCAFNNNYVTGLTGTNLIEAKNIEVYNSNFTNHNKNKVYMTLIKSDEFLIDGCVFKNNVASQTYYASLIATNTEKSGSKGTVTDTLFESNTVKGGCIYFGASGVPLTITNTKFIANKVAATNDLASCIRIDTSPTVNIESSFFIDNTDLGDKSAVIYVGGSYASVYVSNSIILNNSYQNNFNSVFSASTASNLNVYKNIDGNWWGHTEENYTSAPPVFEGACNNWVVMNMTSNVTNLAINQKALISIDFVHMATKDGNLYFRDAGKMPEFVLDVVGVNGTLSSSKVNIARGSGSFEYTLESLTSGSITVSYDNVHSTILFNWALIDADMGIDVDNITYGNSTEISISIPDDIDEAKLNLTINNESYRFNKAISIPKLDAGEYLINLTYAGDSKYRLTTCEKTFKVEKAPSKIDIDINDVYYGNPVKATLTADSELNGEVSVKIGDAIDKKAFSNGKAEFAFENLPADAYAVEVAYPGDKNHLAKNLTSTVNVRKYNSTITVSHGDVSVGSDVVLTFRVNSDASGTITVNVNGKKENVSISQGSATYTIKSIASGLYDIDATYNGDGKYLANRTSTKIDIERLKSTLNVNVSDIPYGENAVFAIDLNDGPSGNVTVSIDGKNYTVSLENGKASLTISDLTAGDKVAVIEYSGDFSYLPCQTVKSFNIAKVQPTLAVDASDIKVGKTLNVQITITKGTTGTLEIITPEETENADIPRTGLITRSVSDLSVGEYYISVIYAGDDNYLGVNATKTVHVTAWDVPQWPNEGYDTGNVQRSPYSTDANGNVAWITALDGDVVGNMAIDSNGNVYIATTAGIYSIKGSDGTTNWVFNTNDAGENFSGIAIGRDMVLAPKSGYKLFFINQTTGLPLNNNLFQGSSVFTPVVDENANIYITSEYQTTTSSYNLVVIPYSLWEFSAKPALINLGKVAPTTAPVLINNNTVIVATEDSLKIIDIASQSVANSFKVSTHVRPVVSDNIVYTIADNSVVAITPSGSMWKVSINGTPGDHLSVGENGEIFVVTRDGVLYEYSTGKEIFIYDFKNSVSQAVLVGQNNVLYVGCENGEFYSIDIEGNLLWSVNLNERLYGLPVMGENGVIYVISGNRIAAIDYSSLKDSNLSASAGDVSYGEGVTINVEIDSEATGSLSLSIGDAYTNESKIDKGHASFVISNLSAGNYTAKITYPGDSRFKSKYGEVKFSVLKITPTINIEYDNVNVGEDLVITVSGLPADGANHVLISGDYEGQFDVVEGVCKIAVSGLQKGTYAFDVKYPASQNYNEVTRKITVEVGKIPAEYSVVSKDISYGEDMVVDVSGMPDDASGTITLNINNQTYSSIVSEGKARITVPGLAAGHYDGEVRYSDDGKYMADSKAVSFNVIKINPSISIQASDIKYGENLKVTINLNKDASGNVIVNVANISQTAKIVEGIAEFEISGLAAGEHDVIVKYAGDSNYLEGENSTAVKVLKVEIPPSEEVLPQSDDLTGYSINLPSDATGTLTVIVDGEKYSADVINGKANVSIHKLGGGKHNITVMYSGDGKYSSIVRSNIVNVPVIKLTGKDVSMLYTAGSYYKVCLTQDGLPLTSKTVSITINGKAYPCITGSDGYASYKITLAPKTYSVTAAYGDVNVTNKVVVKNIINANNVNVKKSAKSIKIKVSLIKVNKKYLKNKKITLKFNKKTFTAKTNKKGVATFTIKNSVYKKLKIGKKYTYQVSYSKNTLKKTIKFKK